MGASSEQLILGRCHALDARQGPLLPFLVAIFLQGGHQGYWQSLSPLGDARQQVWQGPARRQLPRRVASQALFGVAGRLCAQAGWQAERRREATNGLGEGAMCGQGCSAKGVPHCHPSLLCSLGEDRAQPSPRGASTSALAAQSPGLPGSCSPWSPDGGTTWTPSQHPQARGSEPLTPQGRVRARDGVWLTIAAAAEWLARPETWRWLEAGLQSPLYLRPHLGNLRESPLGVRPAAFPPPSPWVSPQPRWAMPPIPPPPGGPLPQAPPAQGAVTPSCNRPLPSILCVFTVWAY